LRKASINDEAPGAEIGDDTVDASIVATTAVDVPTTGATLGGKKLERMELLNNNQRNALVTHFVLLSELGSMSIDDGVGARDN
jgi:hypothetical protein